MSRARVASAMILAAGLGTRIRAASGPLPKPLVAVAGRALIDYAIDTAADAGVERIVINTHYKAVAIEAHLAARRSALPRPALETIHEPERLETGGGVRNALPRLGEGPFLVLNSDSILGQTKCRPLIRLAEAWDDETMDALLLLCSLDRASGYGGRGDFLMGDMAEVVQIKAAPLVRLPPNARTGPVFTGVQILHPRLFADAPDGAYSLNHHYDEAIARGRLYGLLHDGEWFHVGSPQGLAEAESGLGNGCPS